MLHARANASAGSVIAGNSGGSEQTPRDEVAFGATVVLKNLDLDEEEEFTLVGAGEEDYAAGKILVTSPLAQGMIGKKDRRSSRNPRPPGDDPI